MIGWLKATPAWLWTLALGLALGFAAGWWVNGARWDARLSGVERDHAREQKGLAERARVAEAEQRRIERRLQAAMEKVEGDAVEQIERARADADAAGDALERLQQRYQSAVANSRACGNSLTAQLSASTESAARMQADLFRRSTEAVRFYAGVADARGVAGQACEAAFDAVTTQR